MALGRHVVRAHLHPLPALPLLSGGLAPPGAYYKSLVCTCTISVVCVPGMAPQGPCARPTLVSTAKLPSEVWERGDPPVSCVRPFPLLPNLQKQK